MDQDKNKGLADMQDGEFMLNESGTTVSIDADSELNEDDTVTGTAEKNESFTEDAEEAEETKDE